MRVDIGRILKFKKKISDQALKILKQERRSLKMWLRPPLLVAHPTEHKDSLGRLWWGDCNVRCSYLYGGFRTRGFQYYCRFPEASRLLQFFVDVGAWNYSTVLSHQCVLQIVLFSCVVCAVRLAVSIPYLYWRLLSIYSMWKLSLIKPRIIINTATCIKRLFFTYRGFSESRPDFSLSMGAYFWRAFVWC